MEERISEPEYVATETETEQQRKQRLKKGKQHPRTMGQLQKV